MTTKPDIAGIAERAAGLIEWAEEPSPIGIDAAATDIRHITDLICGQADDALTLIAYMDELERGLETQAATIVGLTAERDRLVAELADH